jgi:hypothetical protein
MKKRTRAERDALTQRAREDAARLRALAEKAQAELEKKKLSR